MITVSSEDDHLVCPPKVQKNWGYSFSPAGGYFGKPGYEKSAEDDDTANRDEHRRLYYLYGVAIGVLEDAKGEVSDKYVGAIDDYC